MDTLYRNGTVITMERPLRAEAVLVRDGRIAAVGAAAELRAQAQGPLRSADLKGCTLLPAFVDAHSHFAAAASRFLEISLAGCRTPEEIVARLSEHLRLHPVPPGNARRQFPAQRVVVVDAPGHGGTGGTGYLRGHPQWVEVGRAVQRGRSVRLLYGSQVAAVGIAVHGLPSLGEE